MKASHAEAAREHEILIELETKGQVHVDDLAARFGVSHVTVRKDLATMERRSLLRRVRGGAVAAEVTDEGAFNMRLRSQRETKRALAKAVAPLVNHGDTIAIDSSTTCFYLAYELLERRNLVVVTNGMRVATLFMEQSSAMVLMPGGTLRRPAGSMVGQIADVLQGRGRINKGFFGVKSVSIEYGLTEMAPEEASAKRYLANACSSRYALFSSVKVGQLGLHSFLEPGEISAMYTDERISEQFVTDWKGHGVPVHAVPLQHAGMEAAG